MPTCRLRLTAAAPIPFNAAVFSAPPPVEQAKPPGRADITVEYREACQTIYAGEARHLVNLEAMLDLTRQQQPAWVKWRECEIDAVALEYSDCLLAGPGGGPTDLDGRAWPDSSQPNKAQAPCPARKALCDLLSPEQKAIFNRAGRDHAPDQWRWHGGPKGRERNTV